MKLNPQKSNTIFKARNFFPLLMIPAIAFTSCRKDDDDSTSYTVSEEEAAEVIIKSIEEDAGGFTIQIVEACDYVEIYNETIYCGEPESASVSGSNPSGTVITYNYDYSWDWVLNCSGNTPSSFEFSFEGNSSYDAPRMASSDDVSADLTITGLGAGSNYYVFNQTIERDGSQQSKIRSKRSFTSNTVIETSDLTVKKSTQSIQSGTATATITGSSSTGESFSFYGSIVFNGNQTATLTMNSGDVYSIEW